MGNSEIWELIANHLSGERTAKEEDELTLWINSSEENRRIFKQVGQAWAERQRDSAPERLARGKAMVCERLRQDKRNWWKKTTVVAPVATALLIAALGWYGYTTMLPQDQEVIQIPMKNDGEPQQLLLPDGSTEWLNSESRIQFDNDEIKSRPVFARFGKEESVHQILYMLGLVTNTESISSGESSIHIRNITN